MCLVCDCGCLFSLGVGDVAYKLVWRQIVCSIENVDDTRNCLLASRICISLFFQFIIYHDATDRRFCRVSPRLHLGDEVLGINSYGGARIEIVVCAEHFVHLILLVMQSVFRFRRSVVKELLLVGIGVPLRCLRVVLHPALVVAS